MTTSESTARQAVQQLMPGMEDIYNSERPPVPRPESPRERRRELVDHQLFFAGMQPIRITWYAGVRENRRMVRVPMAELNRVLAEAGQPEMPVIIGRTTWQTDASAARAIAVLRASLGVSGAPEWCSETFSEDIFGQPYVGFEITRVPDPDTPFGFRNEEDLNFYIPGPRDLAASVEDGCPYCTIYRATAATAPRLEYEMRGQGLVAVRHADIADLLQQPDATGVPVVGDIIEGATLYTAESIHETRDVLDALNRSGAPLRGRVVCKAHGSHSYYRQSVRRRRGN